MKNIKNIYRKKKYKENFPNIADFWKNFWKNGEKGNFFFQKSPKKAVKTQISKIVKKSQMLKKALKKSQMECIKVVKHYVDSEKESSIMSSSECVFSGG